MHAFTCKNLSYYYAQKTKTTAFLRNSESHGVHLSYGLKDLTVIR